jgi:phospholipid/cholesterol/gamma-HCH transport system ATP-binding protein
LRITFVIVTHELPSIFAIADRMVMVDARVKKIVAIGSPTELRNHSEDPCVRQFFRREPSLGEAP